MALTRADLSEHLMFKYNLPKAMAMNFVDDFFEMISTSLQCGQIVKLSGFGNFELKIKNARPGRNPKTGEEILITPRRVTTFKAGQKLKERVLLAK